MAQVVGRCFYKSRSLSKMYRQLYLRKIFGYYWIFFFEKLFQWKIAKKLDWSVKVWERKSIKERWVSSNSLRFVTETICWVPLNNTKTLERVKVSFVTRDSHVPRGRATSFRVYLPKGKLNQFGAFWSRKKIRKLEKTIKSLIFVSALLSR